tara:strand:+ start:468 stop:725 length:258 start_codon:yes stop_codon:yes gene_type:complete
MSVDIIKEWRSKQIKQYGPKTRFEICMDYLDSMDCHTLIGELKSWDKSADALYTAVTDDSDEGLSEEEQGKIYDECELSMDCWEM